METAKLLEEFTESRNNNGNIVGAYGYGSGIFKQANSENIKKSPMRDLIFVVEDTKLFHDENKVNHPHDYPISAKIAFHYLDLNALSFLTGVTYQSKINFADNDFKYGVIGKERFISTMEGDWKSFFIAGRFQKPIHTIKSTSELDDSIKNNRDLGLFVALLTLPKDKHTLFDLYTQITKLSFNGDIRMLFAENPNKIKNIVNGSFSEFLNIYGTENDYFISKPNGEIIINYDLLYIDIYKLPCILFEILYNKGSFVHSEENERLLMNRLSTTNFKDSLAQPATGLVTVGLTKSLSYVGQKVIKRFSK